MKRALVFFLSTVVFLIGTPVFAQEVTATMSQPTAMPATRGQVVVDIATFTHHPAYLEAQSLKTPNGVRIVASGAAPDNARTCPRGVASGSECRQFFRITLDAGTRCRAAGDYEALFRVKCWPGTAASLCQPGAYEFNFRLKPESLCQAPPDKGK